jgi:hypothetical protein
MSIATTVSDSMERFLYLPSSDCVRQHRPKKVSPYAGKVDLSARGDQHSRKIRNELEVT